MNIFVVDASVVIKWFVPEIYSEAALRLRNTNYDLHVPDLLRLEIGNTLCKKQRQTELTQEDSENILKLLQKLPLHWHCDDILFHQAFILASNTQRSLYRQSFSWSPKLWGVESKALALVTGYQGFDN